MKNADNQIPLQTEGRQTDFSDSITLEELPQARSRFLQAKVKMLDVGNWHVYSGPGSATFGLTDERGVLQRRLAQVGDYICIDLPATPGPDAGQGLEWVQVESITETGHTDSAEEALVMIVHPVPDPRRDEPETAHFYKSASSSTFMVCRAGLKVSAEAHGRNESPNNTNVSVHDAMRNTAIALSARVGLSGMQWQKLVEGVLEDSGQL